MTICVGFMRIDLRYAENMRVNLVFIDQKDVVMTDIKKQLLDIADTIRYWDLYDLTVVPNILKEASERIGNLELEVIDLELEVLNLKGYIDQLQSQMSPEQEIPQSYSTDKIELYPTTEDVELKPISDRAQVKKKLKELGITFDSRDNTSRLRRRLQKALRGSEGD